MFNNGESNTIQLQPLPQGAVPWDIERVISKECLGEGAEGAVYIGFDPKKVRLYYFLKDFPFFRIVEWR